MLSETVPGVNASMIAVPESRGQPQKATRESHAERPGPVQPRHPWSRSVGPSGVAFATEMPIETEISEIGVAAARDERRSSPARGHYLKECANAWLGWGIPLA